MVTKCDFSLKNQISLVAHRKSCLDEGYCSPESVAGSSPPLNDLNQINEALNRFTLNVTVFAPSV